MIRVPRPARATHDAGRNLKPNIVSARVMGNSDVTRLGKGCRPSAQDLSWLWTTPFLDRGIESMITDAEKKQIEFKLE
jgi:hypothetical protein